MIRVLIADDHAVVRRGLRQILAETPDITAAGEAGTGREVLQRVGDNDYDLVVLDMVLPDSSGLEILQQLRSLRPKLPVLILSVYPEKQYALRALKSGAGGYLTKQSVPDELTAAIRMVAQGGKYISQSLAELMAAEIVQETEGEPYEALSDREYQVMRLLASGHSIGEIATEFSLSPKTISTYRSRILDKLGLNNTAEIIRYAIEHKLVE
jgi:two-component system invasion response regulator UvrY